MDIDVEEGILSGRVMNIRDVIHFQADTLTQLQKEFEFSVDDYIAFCKERGIRTRGSHAPARFSLRVSPKVHSAAISAASLEGMSLNAWISKTIEKAAIGLTRTSFVERASGAWRCQAPECFNPASWSVLHDQAAIDVYRLAVDP